MGILDKLTKKRMEERIKRGGRRLYGSNKPARRRRSRFDGLLDKTVERAYRAGLRTQMEISKRKVVGRMIVKRKVNELVTGMKSGFRSEARTLLSDKERRRRRR